jgi:predicted dehydrogenase
MQRQAVLRTPSTGGTHRHYDVGMLQVGLIGLGVHGRRYVRHLVEGVPGMRLVAVCQRHRAEAERIAHQAGVRAYDDAAALIDDPAVQAVLVVTPPPSHLVLAAAALERRKPVLLEKPLTQTLGEAHDLQTIVARSGAPLFLGQTLRYNTALQLARRELRRIGAIRAITVSQRLAHAGLSWQNSDSTHPLGSILNTGVHLFDLVRWMFGLEFDRVYCQTHRVENPFHEDLFKMQATMQNHDALVALEVAKCTASRSSNLEVVGADGQLWVDYQLDSVLLLSGSERTMLREPAPVLTLPRMLADFAQHIEHGAPMPITVQDGVRTLEVVEACYRSLAEHRAEPVARPRLVEPPVSPE